MQYLSSPIPHRYSLFLNKKNHSRYISSTHDRFVRHLIDLSSSVTAPPSCTYYHIYTLICNMGGATQALQNHVSGQSNIPLSEPAHALKWSQVAEALKADTDDGLATAEAEQRLEKYGLNEFGDAAGLNPSRILVRQIANAMTLVLILAMAVSFGIQSFTEGAVVAGVVAINISVGFYQEFQAEKTMDSLRSLSSPTATAVRGGQSISVSTKEIVPGDIVEMKTGDTIPADVRLIEAVNFETDEALLTGESLPIRKVTEDFFDPDTGSGDRLNVAYSSSTVTKGRATGVCFATGRYTEIGSIAAPLRKKDSKVRSVKRNADGSAQSHRYMQAAILHATMLLATFLVSMLARHCKRNLPDLLYCSSALQLYVLS